MKFDVIVGNPPYQDGSQTGGQNKIYMLFCKQALSLLSENGKLAFVTPTSVAKTSKRFTLENLPGLKYINYTADNYFTVGIEICSWMIDREYRGSVTLKSNVGEEEVDNKGPFFDSSKHSREFVNLYKALKSITSTPMSRMFKQNNFGPAMKKQKDKNYVNELYKLTKDGEIVLTYYTNKEPYFKEKRKISIAMTKSINEKLILDSMLNFDVGYMTTEIEEEDQFNNIKSFILSDYFIEHCNKWKALDGYGFNYGLKYLPPFNKDIQWNNDSVKEFLESFI